MEKISVYVSYIRNILYSFSSDRDVLEIERPQTKGLDIENRTFSNICGFDLVPNPGFKTSNYETTKT